MRNKIICIFFGLLLALLGLELFLRFLGFGYNLIHKTPVDAGAAYRIFCVGESTTWGIGASDKLMKGYPRQLEEMLNKKFPGTKIQCFFDQTIGQNTSEISLKFPRYIENFRPQLIIFMVGANNWWNMDRSNVLLFNKSPVSQMVLRALIFLDGFRVWKLLKSTAFSLGFYKERWNYWSPNNRLTAQERRERFKKNNVPIFDKITRYDLGEMIQVCKRNGIKAIVCNYPVDSRESLREVQRDVAKKNGVPFVDNYTVFGELENTWLYLSKDRWHPNDQGYALVAQNIYRCILENKFIE